MKPTEEALFLNTSVLKVPAQMSVKGKAIGAKQTADALSSLLTLYSFPVLQSFLKPQPVSQKVSI